MNLHTIASSTQNMSSINSHPLTKRLCRFTKLPDMESDNKYFKLPQSDTFNVSKL